MLSLLAMVAFDRADPELYLIPTPQSVVRRAGEFPLDRGAKLFAEKKHLFEAEQLITESPPSFGWGPSKTGLRVVVTTSGADKKIEGRLRSLGLQVPSGGKGDAYVLSVRPREILCVGRSDAGAFYAVQTLRQLVRANRTLKGIPSMDIVDWPSLEIRGWQDDVSRGPIPTLAFLKKQVRELSAYKLNAFTLYTEHVFRLKKHPAIAPADGLTAQEIKELDAYCKKHHVQLIGNFQSFGHFANILSVPGYEKLAETSWVISPAKEESYAFLKDVYDEIAPAYSSPLFNINCDETWGLGEGPSKEMVQREGLGNVYAKHINRISDQLREHGKTPMMWGDIALQHAEIRQKLPKDLIVLTWGYDPRQSFDSQITPFTQMGFRFLVCPGVSCWNQVFPDLDAATVNISNFTRDGVRNGALGVLNTTWDDSGENLFNNNWHPLVWGAEVAWRPAVAPGVSTPEAWDAVRTERLRRFDDSFPRLFYGLPNGNLSKSLWKLSRLRTKPVSGGMADGAFWAAPWTVDPASAKAPANTGFGKEAAEALMGIQHARSQARFNKETLDAAEVAVAKASYLYAQAQTMAFVPDALKMKPEDREWMAAEFTDALSNQLVWLKDHYAKAWRLEARPWWLDRNLAKFDRAVTAAASFASVPLMNPAGGAFKGKLELRMGSLNEKGELRYTLDGSEPTSSSSVYKEPLVLEKSAWVKAKRFLPDGQATPTVSGLFTSTVKPCTIETSWSAYGGHVPALAFDGLDETFFWSNGAPGAGSTFTIVFDEPDLLPGVTVVTGHRDHPDDYVKEGVVEVSPDGQRWREIARFEKGVAKGGMVNFNVKALRIRVTKDNGNWLVIREIALR